MDTSDLHLLIPRLDVAAGTVLAVAGSTIAGVRFSDTVGIGSVLVAAVVVIVAGVFTLRNNLKAFWKNLADERGQQVKELERKLAETTGQLVAAQVKHTEEMAAFTTEQSDIRHELRTEIANLEARLKLEAAKTDLSSVQGLLVEIRDQLAAYTLTPRERRTP